MSLETNKTTKYVNNNIEVRSINNICREKAIITIILTVYLSPKLSSMQYVWSILPSAARLTVPYFCKLINYKIFEKKNILTRNVFYDFLYSFYVKHFLF